MTAVRYGSGFTLTLAVAVVLASAVPAFGQYAGFSHDSASTVMTLKVDGATLSPSSPRQWLLDGVKLTATGQGTDLVLHSGPRDGSMPAPDLFLDFDGEAPMDGAGRWAVETIGPYARAPGRFGDGAGTFRAPQTKLDLRPRDSSLFMPDQPMGDFSMEFWLNPARADSGEIVMLWKATRKVGRASKAQQFTALVLRNRMTYGFVNFFSDAAGRDHSVSLQGTGVLVPGRWSHHLIRHDAATGLLEYLMDGKPEAVVYVTATGRQGGALLAATSGGTGRLEVASNYTGLLDELAFHSRFVEDPALARHAPG
ncbi:MAG: LamG-like jellyroll fold domain-containing protein, partial [Spirochaetia bacterium]|nr:LamG-like jellyroll fold domain-containing protein [Spirochaetia bacterium]